MSLILFQCTYIKEVTISTEHKPSIELENEKILINKFWKLNPKNKDFEFLDEFNKLILEVLKDNFFENEVIQDKIEEITPVREENNKEDFKIQDLDWQSIQEKYNVRYIIYGGVDFKIDDASGYVYKRVYNPQHNSFEYENVYQKKVMYNFSLKIVLYDLKKNEEIFNKKYNSSITREGQETYPMSEFERITLNTLDDFLTNFNPTYEKQTRYLIGI